MTRHRTLKGNLSRLHAKQSVRPPKKPVIVEGQVQCGEEIMLGDTFYAYEVRRHQAGWRLVLMEDEVEVGGGVFPENELDQADETGSAWLDSRY